MPRAQPRVDLVRFTPDPTGAIAAAARLCYAQEVEGLLEHEPAEARKFVHMLVRLGHMSPIEHAGFTFLLQGVSRAMTHQLVRHRIASYSQRSQRYVAEDDFDYVVPPRLEGRTVKDGGREVDAVAYYEETMAMIAERYGALNDALGRRGEASNEDARYVLPNACESKILVTMNARELLHFFGERLCRRAQWEIRGVAQKMLELAKRECPAVFEGCGPKCVRLGGCPEGRMSCGRYREMVERYAS